MQMPSPTRPQRPLRWSALARDTASIGNRWNFARGLYRLMRARPLSTTNLTAGIVSDVSATLVASTTLRRVCGANIRSCSAEDNRA